MRILVCIANYGLKNTYYVKRLIDEYNSFKYEVDVVILSDEYKDYGENVDVSIGLPSKNPWSLPFGWKKIFLKKQNDYDIFIYSEDDTLITEDHVNLFIKSTGELPDSKILGFLRYEVGARGDKYCSSVHSHYHWEPGSVTKYGDNHYAFFTNLHSACFMLTKKHLKQCLLHHDFMRPPCEGLYDMLCTAATEPYTVGGLEKVININNIDKSVVHHMPNQYLGKMGLSFDKLGRQVKRMIDLGEGKGDRLIPSSTNINNWKWEKRYYFKGDDRLYNIIPKDIKSVLSVGCGDGDFEKRIMTRCIDVDAIPLDDYMAILAEDQGVNCLQTNIQQVQFEYKYDLIILSDILTYYQDSCFLLNWARNLLSDYGKILIRFENFNYLKNFSVKFSPVEPEKPVFFIPFTRKKMQNILRSNGFFVTKIEFSIHQKLQNIRLGPFVDYFSREIYMLAEKV